MRLSAVLSPALAVLWAFLGSGCETQQPPDQLARAVAVGERPVAMEGTATFFDGSVVATVTVSRGIGKGTSLGKSKHGATLLDTSGMETDEASAYYKAKAEVGSPLPPVTIRLKLKNLGAGSLSIGIDDFNSDLGNFAVEPSPINLPPGQDVQPEPMVSQLGVTSDNIPFKVTLVRNGKKETQVIPVLSVATPPPASH